MKRSMTSATNNMLPNANALLLIPTTLDAIIATWILISCSTWCTMMGSAHAAFANNGPNTHHHHRHAAIITHHRMHRGPNNYRLPRNLRLRSRYYEPMERRAASSSFFSSTSLQSLRDIMDDDHPPPSSPTSRKTDGNSNSGTQRHDKLTRQLTNLSTREITRESTTALRSKKRLLVNALADARSKANNESGSGKRKRGKEEDAAAIIAGDDNTGSFGGAYDRNNDVKNDYANRGPDVKTMTPAEIERELNRLRGVSADNDSLFTERRDLEEALARERQSRARGSRGVEIGSNFGSASAREVTIVPGAGNVKSNRVGANQVATQLNAHRPSQSEDGSGSDYASSYYDDDDDAAANYNIEEEEEEDDVATTVTTSNSERLKLRELQIAYEFEKVQSSLPEPSDVSRELEAEFSISTKYFLGFKEMAYALAVARVDDRFEKRRAGMLVDDDGCVVGEDGRPIPKSNPDGSSGFDCITAEDELPTPEELIAMEYDNLRPWTELSLSEELENQYGIPAKHFMGRKEMAYALAVERVDRAMKEGGFIMEEDDYYDDDDDDEVMVAAAAERNENVGVDGGVYNNGVEEKRYEAEEEEESYGVMTDDDMMRMMEEEMRKEEEEEQRLEGMDMDENSFYERRLEEEKEELRRQQREISEQRKQEQQQKQQQQQQQQQMQEQQQLRDARGSSGSVRDSPSSRRFEKQDPNPFQKPQAPPATPAYQSTPLADMIKTDKKRDRVRPQERRPLSSEPPLGSQRQSPTPPWNDESNNSYNNFNDNSINHNNNNNYGMNNNMNGNDDFIDMGTTIGDRSAAAAAAQVAAAMQRPKETKSLHDILKGTEQQHKSSSRSSRSQRATMPPQRPNAKQPAPRSSRVKFTKTSARVDDSFATTGYTSGWNRNAKRITSPLNKKSTSSSNNNYGPNFASTQSNRGYGSSWSKGSPHAASSAPKRNNANAARGGGGGGGAYASQSSSSQNRQSQSSSQNRPFEPAPFTAPGSHNMNNAGGSSSSGPGGPQRVPPSTPFNNPVTDGPQSRRPNSQGPFTPFTEPPVRSTNGKPPPQTRKKRTGDPRGFNIKDTPDDTQPFAGSQYFDQNTFGQGGYSPPLQVEPPPRDPNYVPPERPFEPAPFSNPQPHAVRTGATNARDRNKWNTVGTNNGDGAANRRRSYEQHRAQQQQREREQSQRSQQQQQQQQQQSSQKKVHKTGSKTPFDNLKDMFNNIGNNKRKDEEDDDEREVFTEESAGFKSGNVEVFSTEDDDDAPKKGWGQNAFEVEIIDAEMWTGEEEEEEELPPLSSSSAGGFSNDAWMGGAGSTDTTSSYTSSNGFSHDASNNIGQDHESYTAAAATAEDQQTIQRAQHLLANSQKVRLLVAQAQSNPKIRRAVQECIGNPAMFGRYLDDEEVGPLLKELKECILV